VIWRTVRRIENSMPPRMLPLPDAPLLTDQSKLANHGHGKAKGI
jgi:hypothetical protein